MKNFIVSIVVYVSTSTMAFHMVFKRNARMIVGCITEGLCERTEHLDIFLFPPITQWCSIYDVLFTGGRGVSDFSVLKYY